MAMLVSHGGTEVISTRLVLFGIAVVSIGLLSGSLQHAAAQSVEEAVRASKTELHEPAPSSEPASDRPTLRIEIDGAGVDVVQGPARTADGYTLGEMEPRVRRARIGLLSMTGVTLVGVALFGAGVAGTRSSQDLNALSPSRGGLLVAGMTVGLAGSQG